MKKEVPMILCPCPIPKRILSSDKWVLRNDSSSINALLHPEHFCSPRSRKKPKEDAVPLKLEGNNCYCRCKGKKLPKPVLFNRPNSCINYHASTSSKKEGSLKARSLINCVCDNNIKRGVSELGRSQEPLLRYSDQRLAYEKYRQSRDEELKKRLENFQREDLNADDSFRVDTLLEPRSIPTATTISNSNYLERKKSLSRDAISDEIPTDEFPVYSEWSIPDFRKEHYFETHDIGKISKITGDTLKDQPHTCVHQFKLNSKQLLEPIETDAFGRSLCKICCKPMEGSSLDFRAKLFHSEAPNYSKIKNLSSAHRSSMLPSGQTIHLGGGGKSKIELLLDDRAVTKLSSYIDKVKKPVLRNSLALRHQKLRHD